MRNRLASIITAVMFVFSTGTAVADFSAKETESLNALIEAYIKDNPKVVRDALIALADQEEQQRRTQALSMVKADEGDPFMGAGDEADIVIYEFSDYNCGYCKRVFTQLQEVLQDDPKVRLTLKEYPILAESSLEAARAAVAAGMQGKFEAFHIGMMNYRGAITMDGILSVAAESDLDLDRLQADMTGAAVENILQRTRATAQALEVSGTPALVIGTEFVPGAISADQIKEIIKAQRAAKSS
ncbi:MAG: DsbA family protein [Candidatus Puniceispirillaceae bacterium]